MRPLLLIGLTLLVTACAKDAPQDTLQPEGPIARQTHNLFVPVFIIATVIFFLVEGLIVFAAIRFRDRPGAEEPKQIHGNSKLEFAWTLIPALLLIGVAIPTVLTVFDQDPKHVPDEVAVKVIGHQWWWEYIYEGTNINTANELVIPINRPVFLELESADVIHSFWVPKLAGKQDVVPERINTMRLIAEKPGTYLGQCAEFCSLSHANMRLRVVAKTEADYEQWVRAQQQPGLSPASGDALTGKELFLSNACIQCHAISGTPAGGTAGPNLTHFADRKTFGAASFETNEENLLKWIRDARSMKPGVIMPAFLERNLSDQQIRQIIAYLLSLK